jgi:hypothetical protein
MELKIRGTTYLELHKQHASDTQQTFDNIIMISSLHSFMSFNMKIPWDNA